MHRLFVRSRPPLIWIVALTLVGAFASGCGEDGDGDKAESLKDLLPPPAQLGPLRVERSFAWDHGTDFIVEGFHLPEATAPSLGEEQMDDAGFVAGAGNILRGRPGPDMDVAVAAFDSGDGATEAQKFLHEEDLKQPCFAACAVNPRELELEGIPGATAVHQAPKKGKLPPELEPFEAFAVEFTIGSNLFYAHVFSAPDDLPPARPEKVSLAEFEKIAVSLYKHASQRSD